MSITEKLIEREKNGEFPEQKSDRWYEARQNMLTASEISSALDCNIYQTSYDLLLRKISPIEHISNEATEWGNMFESVALGFYEYKHKIKVQSLGLITHSKYNWIGASPDGLLLSGKLLEIKCPIHRVIGSDIPLYYWIQIQIQMEVCDLNECDYFECKFHKYSNKEEYDADKSRGKNTLIYQDKTIYYKYIGSYLKTFIRDKSWFNGVIEQLQNFYNKIIYYCGLNNGIEQLKIDSRKYQKRKLLESNEPIFKSPCLTGFIKWDNWVSATRIRNYMIDDPIIDWLELYAQQSVMFSDETYKQQLTSITEKQSTFQQCIMKQGTVFEQKIIGLIKQKFPIVVVANYQESKSYNKYMETVALIKKGTPIIYQGVLHDYENKIFGMPDLLVRSDYVNKLFKNEKPLKNPSQTTYRVIEIKFISLELYADGQHIRNTKNIPAYKGQLYMYNKILGNIQGTTPTKSYIIGKRWSYKKGKESFSGDSFERLGHVDFKNNDSLIRTKTTQAIKWIREQNKNGYTWSAYGRDELKPNMCNVDNKWQTIKQKIAHDHNDITLLWYCNIKTRQIAETRGIKNWRTHKNLTSEMLGIKGNKTASTLQLIIDLNQDPSIIEKEQESIVVPKKIKSNLYNWKKPIEHEFYIDFETIMPEIMDDNNQTFLFMIGVGKMNNDNSWEFNCFIADSLTTEGEKNMLMNFHKYIESFKGPKNLWHWGNAEQYLYRSCINKHTDVLSKYNLLTDWCDLLKLFKDEPIITRGMLNFSLKTVVKAFYNNCLIETSYNELDVNNGLDAMVQAYKLYKDLEIESSNNIEEKMIDIKKYNEIDCKSLYEILRYLRDKH